MKAKLYIIFFLVSLCFPSYAQLSDGKYKIVGYRTLISGETKDNNVFTSEALLRVADLCKVAVLRIDGFAVHTFVLDSPIIQDGNYVYKAKEYFTNTPTTIIYIPMIENGVKLNGGMLMHIKSDTYTDVFAITKEE